MYEEDEEALAIWRDVVGVDPSRIRKMGAADNFWASGPTGTGGAGASTGHRSWQEAAQVKGAVTALLCRCLVSKLPPSCVALVG